METIDKFDEEGEIEIIKRERVRIECDICGKPAHFKHTFLLPNARINPTSSGYGKDDISRYEDEHQFSCNDPECIKQGKKMDGYHWCSTYPAIKGFKHLFLRWEEIKDKEK